LPDPTLYLFDGHNVLHAGGFGDANEVIDLLASFVGLRGARGIVVFDGTGADREIGPLAVRFAPHADTLLERLSAEHRQQEVVCLVSSDAAVRGVSGQEVRKLSSSTFLAEFERVSHTDPGASRVRDRLDPAVRERLEQLRRGGG
jgi:predicted RNA-binding protein with PIN domain